MRAAVIACAIALLGRTAAARPLETFVDVAREDDLYDLAATGAIDDDTLDALDELLARGVDLDQADRDELYALPNLTYGDVDAILAFRAAHGGIADPGELVGVISREKLVAISAFLIVHTPRDLHGFVVAQTRWSQRDRVAPPTMLRARAYVGSHVTAGAGAMLDRLRLGAASWDASRGAIVADAPGLSLDVPKAFVRWRDDALDAIAGSYRIGFGQRLTFDDSFDPTPDGISADDQIVRAGALTRACREGAGELATTPCPRSAGATYVSPDYAVRESLFGAAIGARAIAAGAGWAQAYAWASYHRRSIYQYELYDADRCDDPRSAEASCAAPPVLVRGAAPAPAFAYATVPDVFREALVGANATYFADRRRSIGVTGYGARTLGLIDGADLGYQEWANRPGASGDRFGAIGVNATWGARGLDIGAEVARSFDDMHPAPGAVAHGGGGTGAVVTATATERSRVIEASVRWYGVDFVNPYAKSIEERDAFEGERARDEAGARVRYLARHGDLNVRAQVDVWDRPAERVPRTDDYVRLDHAIDAPIGWGLWLEFEDKDLTAGGRGQCFDATAVQPPDAITGAPPLCKGMRVSTTARLHVNPSPRLRVTLQATHRLLDDPRHPRGLRNDAMAWVLARYRPSDRVSVHARARYLFQDVATPGYLEESFWAYADVTLRVRGGDAVRARADLYAWLDSRASTITRSPNPELSLWLEYEARF